MVSWKRTDESSDIVYCAYILIYNPLALNMSINHVIWSWYPPPCMQFGSVRFFLRSSFVLVLRRLLVVVDVDDSLLPLAGGDTTLEHDVDLAV